MHRSDRSVRRTSAPLCCTRRLVLSRFRLARFADCSAPVSLRSVLLTEDSALNTLSLRPVPLLSPFPDCSVFRDLALLARSRIAPLPCF